MSWRGHAWTIWPAVRRRLGLGRAPRAEPWSTTFRNDRGEDVRLTGLLRRRAGSEAIVIVVHGLGGHPRSHYCQVAARAAERAGCSTLRVALRGADRMGEDLYHAALTEDLHEVLRSPEVAEHARVHVLGYSMGGHVTLCLATEESRVESVAAVCTPLDLAAIARHFDEETPWVYRRHVLGGLVRSHAALHRRGRALSPHADVRRIRGVREWDRLTVVPRHGYADVPDYYSRASVGPRLSELRVPALLVASEHDPMIVPETIRPALRSGRAPEHLVVQFVDAGGHLGFPADLDLGMPGPRGLEGQVLAWLLSHGRPRDMVTR